MKKFIFALASLALISSANAASDSSDVKFNAEMWIKYFANKNVGGVKTSTDTYWTQRTKVGAHWTKGDDLGAQVTLLTGTIWGADAITKSTDTGLGYVGDSADVYEAWVFWKPTDNMVVKAGRGAMDLADGTVVSKNDNELHPYAFDGIMAAYYTEPVAFNFFGVKGYDNSLKVVSPATNWADINFYGLSLDARNLPEVLKMANLTVMQQQSFGVGGITSQKTRYSVTLKGDVSGFDYRGTYAAYTGKDKNGSTTTDHKGNMYDVEAGYTFRDMMNFRLSALYHQDSAQSGTTDNYDAFFYDVHNNAGLMDIIKWGNLKYFKIGASVEPVEMTTVGLAYYDFKLNKKSSGGPNAGLAGTGDKIGSEIDVFASKQLSNGATFGLRYGQFKPEAAAPNDETISQYFADAKFTF